MRAARRDPAGVRFLMWLKNRFFCGRLPFLDFLLTRSVPQYISLSSPAHTAKMVSLKLQKRLAASVLKCGARKIWMDPNEVRVVVKRKEEAEGGVPFHHGVYRLPPLYA